MISVSVANTAQLLKDLRKARIDVKDEAWEVLKEMAKKVQQEAKNRVSVDSGALQSTIRRSVSRKNLTARVNAGGKYRGVDAFYAPFIEFGTKNMSARPFLYPSGRYYENETQQRLTEEMFKALRKDVG